MTLQGARAHNGPRDPYMAPRWGGGACPIAYAGVYGGCGGMSHNRRWGMGGEHARLQVMYISYRLPLAVMNIYIFSYR
jgi:hypothetical protein